MKVIIVSPVEHDGKPLKVSSKPVDLPVEAAAALLAAGAAVKLDHPAAAALFEAEETAADQAKADKVLKSAAAKAAADQAAADKAVADQAIADQAVADKAAADKAAADKLLDAG